MKLGAFFLGVTLAECPCKEISEDLGFGRVEGEILEKDLGRHCRLCSTTRN